MAENQMRTVPGGWREPSYYSRFMIGIALMLGMLPCFSLIMGSSVVWYVLDFGSSLKLADYIDKALQPYTSSIMRNPADGFVVCVVMSAGVMLPLLGLYNLLYTMEYGFSFKMWYLYHLWRVGPMAMHFSIVNTLCHKEGHTYNGMFKQPYNSILRYSFNWWIGLFYGLAPSTYTFGHSRNHHTYNNEHGDVVSTGDMPRDNFMNYVAYIPRWFAYHINITTYIQFKVEKNEECANKMVMGSLYYITFVVIVASFSPIFAIAYILYPLLETGVFLSAVNWSWHAFTDPNDPTNEFVSSITILSGPFNVLNEDYHVVHHQYPGTHWTKHPELFEKHREQYIASQATIFEDCHAIEVFVYSVLRQYKRLARKYVDLSGKLSLEEKEELMRKRLQAVTWDSKEGASGVIAGADAKGPKNIWKTE
eukprot:m.32577 g.32577  ORF g.32577 m.32577 type:complete len:421 (-) comp8428_c0_seq2:1680-2942(-)